VEKESSRPAKRPRVTPPPERSERSKKFDQETLKRQEKKDTDKKEANKAEKKLEDLALPPLLSPTLPAIIEEELAKFAKSGEKDHRRTISSASANSDTIKLHTPSHSASPNLKSNLKDGLLHSSPHYSSKSPRKFPAVPSGKSSDEQRVNISDAAGKSFKDKPPPGTPDASGKTARPTATSTNFFTTLKSGNNTTGPLKNDAIKSEKLPRRLVKLKYGKKNAKSVERVLKLKSMPNQKSESGQETSRPRDRAKERDPGDRRNLSEKESGRPSSSNRQPEKRSLSEDRQREYPEKRQKPSPASLDDVPKSRAAVTPAFKSPNVTTPSRGQISQTSTPRKTDSIKSVPMKRVDSTEASARTPQGYSSVTTSVPPSAEKERPLNGHPADRDSRGGSVTRKDKTEEERLMKLAISLKHRRDELLQTKESFKKSTPVTDADKKLADVVGLESIL